MADERVRINDLPADASPSPDDNVAIDRASTRRTTVKQLVAAALPIAIEPQAREGLNDTVAMTPLKTAQAIETLGSARFATAAQGNLAATAVQPERSIAAGTGLSGGGDLSQNRTVALNVASIASLAKADSAVQPERTVSAGSGLVGGGTLAANVSLALSSTSLASLTLADSSVQPSRKFSAGTGLSGGGDFSADRSISLNSASIASLALADSAVQPARLLTAGTGLTGGGDLSANRSIALSPATIASLELADNAVPNVRTVTAGAGLAGGGALSADILLNLSATSQASLAKADTAVQPAGIAGLATKAELTAGLATKLDTGAQAADSAKLQGYTPLTLPIPTTTQTALDRKATIAQGAKADTAVQPSDLGALATKSKVATTDIDATGSTASGALLTLGGTWVDPSGGGDMFRATYDPNNKAADAFSMGNMVETTAAKVMTAAERTKLAGVAAGATANTGTVTSVGVAVPTGLSATGAIATSGTITISYAAGYQGYTTAEANKLAGIPADADKTPALAAVATTGSYGDLSNKPATFPPSAHTHSPSEVGLGNVANKSEAQMVASGAIADALSNKVSLTAQILTEEAAGQARANLGADILAGFRNKIINGDFEIWQRGESGHTNFGYTADRWGFYRNAGTEAGTASRQLFPLGSSEVQGNPAGYFRAAVTNGGPAANGFISVGQQIEEVRTLAGKKATLTFYARVSTPREIAIELSQAFGSGGSPRLNILVGKAQLTTTWKKFSYVIDVPSLAGKTVGSNACVALGFILSAGTDFSARTGGLTIQTGTFDFSRVSIVEGDASAEADPFSPRHIQQEFALCQRYFQRVSEIVMQAAFQAGHANRTTMLLPVPMRVSPTITYTSSIGSGVAILSSSIADRLVLAAFPGADGLISAGGIKLDAEL